MPELRSQLSVVDPGSNQADGSTEPAGAQVKYKMPSDEDANDAISYNGFDNGDHSYDDHGDELQ
jgi:hypothetical protein